MSTKKVPVNIEHAPKRPNKSIAILNRMYCNINENKTSIVFVIAILVASSYRKLMFKNTWPTTLRQEAHTE